MYLTTGRKILALKNVCNYSKNMFTRINKPIRIIRDPDKQRPDKWRSTEIRVRRGGRI